jgi:nitroreductase
VTTQPGAPRIPDAPVDPQFLDRWSPRSFTNEPVTDDELRSLFEAARWAPSSGNEQPWIYLYASSAEDHDRFLNLLNSGNQAWAFRAPVLAFVIARRHTRKGNPNRTALFDTGSSWMSLALEARKLGLYAHGMAGFDVDSSYDVLHVPRDRYEVIAAIAIGRRGDPSMLKENNRAREFPSSRQPTSAFAFPGSMPEEHR